MRKIIYIILGIWSAISCLLSPVWLTVTFLNFSGRIYQLDPTMDEGTALIIGGFMLLFWMLAALFPNILFLRTTAIIGKRYLWMSVLCELFLIVLCCGMCGWNIVSFVVG